MNSRIAPFVRFGLSVFTLALGAYDLAECGVRTLADEALSFWRVRVYRVVVGIVVFALVVVA